MEKDSAMENREESSKSFKEEWGWLKNPILYLVSFVIILSLWINIAAYPSMMKDREKDRFESGIFFKDYLFKNKYEKIGEGISLECFGGYSTYKMKNNSSVSFNTYLTVCD